MDRCVLDTTVIIKSIFKPPKSLSSERYKVELETHEKCRAVIKKLEERDMSRFTSQKFVLSRRQQW